MLWPHFDLIFLFVMSVCVCACVWICAFVLFVCSLFPVDIWSVGCIMGEMVKGSVIFQGTDRILHFSHRLCAAFYPAFHPPSKLHPSFLFCNSPNTLDSQEFSYMLKISQFKQTFSPVSSVGWSFISGLIVQIFVISLIAKRCMACA